MAEQRMVKCVKLNRELPGLAFKPLNNELGQRIYDQVSQEAWKMWLAQQTMVINELRLNVTDPKTRQMLNQRMEQFFFGGADSPPPGFVPPPRK
ncbi:MAG: oxidative damage protection protein [Acidobacteriota bacterium]